MNTDKRERTIVDDVSAQAIDKMIHRAGMNNPAIDRASRSAIGYNRVRDIRKKLKAPVKLSEFLIICDVCNADPVQTLREIIAEAAQYAVDHLQADYNANALAKAKSYQGMMSMSSAAIYDQLVPSAGEKFTPEEAQYANDNLNK